MNRLGFGELSRASQPRSVCEGHHAPRDTLRQPTQPRNCQLGEYYDPGGKNAATDRTSGSVRCSCRGVPWTMMRGTGDVGSGTPSSVK